MAKLPILMYHKVASDQSKGLTISAEKLAAQFQFLASNGYQSYHLSTLAILKKLPQPKKNVVITFDDGYVSQLEHAVPLLQKYNLKATFFIPLQYVGAEDAWNEERSPIMDAETLRSLDPSVIELAYHSYAHQRYDEMPLEAIDRDTEQAFARASEQAMPLGPYLAYPYGKFPRTQPQKSEFFNLLKQHQFEYGLRIGNRINRFPFKKPFEIQRIDVKGEWGLNTFKRKIRFGRLL
ncbi:MAG: polysaccharide deacetylase family protein [Bacteroidota bacterium]